MKQEKKWERKNPQKYEFRYEVASERNKITRYILIPKNNRAAEAQHMSEHEAFQAIQWHAFIGESEEVQKLLLGFPEFKREDLKKLLIQSVETHCKTLGL